MILILLLCREGYASPQIVSQRSWIPLENILTGLLLEPDGSLLVLENDAGELSRLLLDQRQTLQRIETVAGGFHDPIALVRANQDLLVAERTSGILKRLHDGNITDFITGLTDISSIRTDAQGNLFITEMETGCLNRFDLDSGRRQEKLTDLFFPSDVLPFPGGLLIAELVDRAGRFGRISINQDGNPLNNPYGNREILASIIDPVRLAADPRDEMQFFISVRHTQNSGPFLSPSGGAILLLNLRQRMEMFLRPWITGLDGPTDIAASRDGIYLLEEFSERISFFDWRGRQTMIWDGLGQPEAFTPSFHTSDLELFVAENKPSASIVRIQNDRIENVIHFPNPYRQERIAGLIQHDQHTFLASFPGRGEILACRLPNQFFIFSKDIFSPGKMKAAGNKRLVVLDSLVSELVVLNPRNGNVLQRFSAYPLNLADFDVDFSESDCALTLFALTRSGSEILQYDSQKERFETITDFQNWENENPVFVYVPDHGFCVALNDENGTILWIPKSGEQSILVSGYVAISELDFIDGAITALSRNGWIRSIRLSFDEHITPTPTPVTPVSNWRLY
ncbi:MAG: hypothetical protein C4527_00620 [Candidatus Omnitrophota bacterium]|jgi:hypothetical protein|nr:MAG: hypothetical protein C4527_00620 [Candidatus Omnitrophota bacterium]